MISHRAFDLYGKTILITGGSSGIDAASAQLLHCKGTNIFLVGLNGQRMESKRPPSSLGGLTQWEYASRSIMDQNQNRSNL